MDALENKQTPWTRLNNESTLAYSFFAIYRDLGPQRSYKKVQIQTGKKAGYIRQIEIWSRKYFWVNRTSLYDDYLDGKKLENAEKGIKELHNHAMSRAKESIDSLMEIANGGYCELHNLKAIEMHLKSIGFFKKD